MNSALREFGARVLNTAGYYAVRRRVDARRGRRLLVLMYHDILDDDARGRTLDDDSPTVSEFAAHVKVAADHFRLLSLSDAVREIQSGGLREDSVAITFDDGYPSVHRNALPVLRRHEAPSTLFVLTGLIAGMTFWWQRLRGIVTEAPFSPPDLDALELALGAPLVGLNGSAAGGREFRQSVARQAEDHLRDMEDTARDVTIDRLRDLLLGDGAQIPLAASALTWDQIRELAAHQVELGAHTVTHINFRYADARTLQEEITNSRDEIARITDTPVTGFAYPYGKDLEEYRLHRDVLRACDIEYACTAVPGNNRSVGDVFSLRRVTPPSTCSTALINHALCQSFVRDDSFYDMHTRRSGP